MAATPESSSVAAATTTAAPKETVKELGGDVVFKSKEETPVIAPGTVAGYFGIVAELEPDSFPFEVPTPGISADILTKMIEFATSFREHGHFAPCRPTRTPDLLDSNVPKWAVDWLAGISLEAKFDLLVAADELRFQQLINLMAASIAVYIKNMDEDVAADTFALSREFTPEEEETIREENPWAEDD